MCIRDRVYAGAWPQVHWPRVSRGGRLVTEVRRRRQSSSPQPDESGRAVPVAADQSRFRADSAPLSTRPFQRPGRSLKADWLDERPTSDGAVRERVEPAHLGRWEVVWRRRTALSTTLAQGSTMLSSGPTGSAPGTASVYKMRLRADPHRSQITEVPCGIHLIPVQP